MPIEEPGRIFLAAKRTFESEDWSVTADLLWRIVKRESRAGEEEVQEAQYMLAVTEFRLNERAVAQSLFGGIVEQTSHRRRRDAADWLCAEFDGETVVLSDEHRELLTQPKSERYDPPFLFEESDVYEQPEDEQPKPAAVTMSPPPDCSGEKCPTGSAVACWDPATRSGSCACSLSDCNYTEFQKVLLCASSDDCFPPGQGMVGICREFEDRYEGLAEPVRSCWGKFLPGPGHPNFAATIRCDTAQSCAAVCLKNKGPVFCQKLFGLAETMWRDASTAPGEAKAAGLFKIACDKDLGEACKALAYVFGTGKGAPKSMTSSAKYYQRACDLTKEADACAQAASAKCVAGTWTAARRDPALDPYCNPVGGKPGVGTSKAYSPAEPSTRIEGDACFDNMRAVGCTGTNVASKGRSAYCCH